MLRKPITDNYSVSEQINLDDVATLAQSGVTLILCNRPDNEEEGQLTFAEVASLAKEKNIAAVHIPFVGGQMQPSDVEAFKRAIKEGDNVHAYCRTGNRSTKIWQAANPSPIPSTVSDNNEPDSSI